MFFNRLVEVVFSRPSASPSETHSNVPKTDHPSPRRLTANAYRGKMMDWFGWDA